MAGTPLRELLAEFGFRFDPRGAQAANSQISSLVHGVRSLAQGFVAGALVRGVASFIQNAVDVGSELHDTALATGISATELTEWRYAARLSGVEAGALGSAMARTALAAARNSPVLRQLGVRTRDTGGQLRRTADIFEDAGVAIGALTNDTQRSALATQLWGRSGRALIPMFRAGRQGVAELRAEVRRLYGTDLEQLAQQSDDVGDAQDRLNLVWDALRTRLAVFLLPAVEQLANGAVDLANGFADLSRHSSLLEGAVLGVGIVLAAVAIATVGLWGPPLSMFVLLVATLGLVALALDDVITTVRGGRSVIRSFVDDLFGAGTTARWVASGAQAIKSALEALAPVTRSYGDLVYQGVVVHFREIRGTARQIGASIEAWSIVIQRAVLGVRELARATGLVAPGGVDIEAERGRLTAQSTALASQLGVPGYLSGGSSAITAPKAGGGDVSLSRHVNVGAIHVDGSSDPIATGRAVQAAIEDAGADSVDDAAHDLVPVGG